jgi:hypothetical protein
MSVDLAPQNENIPSYHSGSFSWGWMAERGVFLSVGCGPLLAGAHYMIGHLRDGAEMGSNDGFPVSADEARAMAHAAYGLWLIEQYKLSQWRALSKEEQDRRMALPYSQQRNEDSWTPIREDFIDRALEFAWFAHASGGFKVY